MSDPKPSTRRAFFRAPVSAKTKVTLMDESRPPQITKCFDLKTFTEAFPVTDPAMTHFMTAAMDMFNRIDQKLDKIYEKLDQDDSEGKSLYALDTVDISGSGVNLLLEEPIENGRMVYLSMVFTGSDRGRMDVMGRVVRCSSVKRDHGSELYHTGVEFVDLSESEKDRLVKYTFSQQRKHIRTAGEEDI